MNKKLVLYVLITLMGAGVVSCSKSSSSSLDKRKAQSEKKKKKKGATTCPWKDC